MKIHPFVSGSGMAGQGMTKALQIIETINPDVKLGRITRLGRGQSLKGLTSENEHSLLLIGNPHGFHAQMILDGIAAGFKNIICDKPVCIDRKDIGRLKEVNQDVAVTHGFRAHWGPQTIKKMIDSGEFGEIISIEGRYWQSSMASAALAGGDKPGPSKDWKQDPAMNGPYDALVDLGAHYTDMMFFFAGATPSKASGWVSHVNSPAPHRDSHAWVEFHFPKFRARGSISKTAHGTGNDLEVTVHGQKQSATWHVERPDELRIARGTTTTLMQRGPGRFGSEQPPFHGLGWLEGYVEVVHQYIRGMMGEKGATYPKLQDSLKVMETLLSLDTRS